MFVLAPYPHTMLHCVTVDPLLLGHLFLGHSKHYNSRDPSADTAN